MEVTNTETTADIDGRFSLNLAEGFSANQVFSYTTFKSQIIIPTDSSIFNVQLLIIDALQLQDVFVTANKKKQSA